MKRITSLMLAGALCGTTGLALAAPGAPADLCGGEASLKRASKPAAGMANGKPFVVKSVTLEPGYDGWTIVLADKAPDKPTGFLPSDAQYFHIKLPQEPGKAKQQSHAMGYGGGYFQVLYKDKKTGKEGRTSWNSDNAWTLDLKSFKAKPYDTKEGMFQVAGTASGRIAVCYKAGATSDLKTSWVVGTFKNAVVRYMGTPYWMKKK